jgi:hypothetical protein
MKISRRQKMPSCEVNDVEQRGMRSLRAFGVAIALLGSPLDAFGYEVATHAAMTREAIMQSQLNPASPDLLQRLGIVERQVSLRWIYPDLADSRVVVTKSTLHQNRARDTARRDGVTPP